MWMTWVVHRACYKDTKRCIREENYQPYWRAITNKELDSNYCMHTRQEKGLQFWLGHPTTSVRIASHYSTWGQRSLLRPPFQVDYKQIHHLLHANDCVYEHLKSTTFDVSLKEPSRPHPNLTAINHNFIECSDLDICVMNEDTICINCYNAHLAMLHES